MSDPLEPEKFFVDRLPAVTVEIRRLITRAKQLGIGQEVFDTLEKILTNLETIPFEWGDPQYATQHGGGMVLHGIQFPFMVQYVAFQKEHLVCILKILVLPRHPLEGS